MNDRLFRQWGYAGGYCGFYSADQEEKPQDTCAPRARVRGGTVPRANHYNVLGTLAEQPKQWLTYQYLGQQTEINRRQVEHAVLALEQIGCIRRKGPQIKGGVIAGYKATRWGIGIYASGLESLQMLLRGDQRKMRG